MKRFFLLLVSIILAFTSCTPDMDSPGEAFDAKPIVLCDETGKMYISMQGNPLEGTTLWYRFDSYYDFSEYKSPVELPYRAKSVEVMYKVDDVEYPSAAYPIYSDVIAVPEVTLTDVDDGHVSLVFTLDEKEGIIYTTDGTDPVASATRRFAGSAITVERGTKVRYRAYIDSCTSAVSEIEADRIPADPVFSREGNEVEIATSTPGASIYYSTESDASLSESGILYEGKIPYTRNATFKAAAKYGDNWSSEVSYDYVVEPVAPEIKAEEIPEGYRVSISSLLEGWEIFYTMDGTEPDRYSLKYEAPFEVRDSVEIKAIAMIDDIASPVASMSLAVDKSSISVSIVKERFSATVTMSSTEGTSILYSLDGTDPSIAYTDPVKVEIDSILKAKAVNAESGYESDLIVRNIEFAPLVAPVITYGFDETNASEPLRVSIATENGTKLKYSMDGGAFLEYTSSFGAAYGRTVKAFAYTSGGMQSEEVSLKLPVVLDRPDIKITDGMKIELSSSTSGTIYYTIDGTEPDNTSNEYSVPFTVDSDCTVKAVVFDGEQYSEIAERDISVTGISKPATYAEYNNADGSWTVTISSLPGYSIEYKQYTSSYSSGKASYTGPIRITSDSDVYKIEVWYASDSDSTESEHVDVMLMARPVIDMNYEGETAKVKITTAPGVKFYYTTDSSMPDLYSQNGVASVEFTVNADATVKARACSEKGEWGPLAERDVVFAPPAVPVIQIEPVKGSDEYLVSFASLPGLMVKYTKDGSDPELDSSLYTSPFKVPGDTVIKAVSVKGKSMSTVAELKTPISLPVITVVQDDFDCVVSIDGIKEGRTVRYTLDGRNPDSGSPVYSDSFRIEDACTLKVVAYDGSERSAVVSKKISFPEPAAPAISFEEVDDEKPWLATVSSSQNMAEYEYSIDGNIWNSYYTPFNVSSASAVHARAIGGGKVSDTTTVHAAVSEPVISYEKVDDGSVKVIISSDPVSTVYYTTDGTAAPDTGSTLYTEPFIITENTHVYAIAYVGEDYKSEVAYEKVPVVIIDVPAFSAAPDETNGKWNVSITGDPDGSTWYSIDNGSTWLEYSESIPVFSNKRVLAKNIVNEFESEIVPFTTEVIKPAIRQEKIGETVKVTLSYDNTTSVYYTLDGKDPDSGDARYNKPFTVSENQRLKVVAYSSDNLKTSEVAVDLVKVRTPLQPIIAQALDVEKAQYNVTLSTTENDSVIKYSFDNGNSWNDYSGPFEAHSCDNISAKVIVLGEIESLVSNKRMEMIAPVITIERNLDQGYATVSILHDNKTEVRYSLDGSAPESGFNYSGQFAVDYNCRIKAVAMLDGNKSSAVEMNIPVKEPVAPTVSFNKVYDGNKGSWKLDMSTSERCGSLEYSLDDIDWKPFTETDVKLASFKEAYARVVFEDMISDVTTRTTNLFKPELEKVDDTYIRFKYDPTLVLRYTLDGSAPDESSDVYGGGNIHISSNCNVKARVFTVRPGYDDMDIYGIDEIVIVKSLVAPAVEFVQAEDELQWTMTLNLSGYKDTAMWYSIGSDTGWTMYTDPVKVDQDTDVRVKTVYLEREESPVETEHSGIVKPVFSQIPTNDTEDIVIDTVPGNKLRYTTDGTDPDQYSTVYNGAMKIEKNCIFKVRAFLYGTASEIAESKVCVVKPKAPIPSSKAEDLKWRITLNAKRDDIVDEIWYSISDAPFKKYIDGGFLADSCIGLTIKSEFNGVESDEFSLTLGVVPPLVKLESSSGSGVKVTISSAEGSNTYYTIDGNTPDQSSDLYTGSFIVDHDCKLAVISFKNGDKSTVTTVNINVNAVKAAAEGAR